MPAIRLVDDVGSSWTWASIRLSAIYAALSGVWLALDPATQQSIIAFLHIPAPLVTLLGFASVIVGRLLTTDPKAPAPATDAPMP
jgi:hypothetical protein